MAWHDEENGMRRWGWIVVLPLVILSILSAGCSSATPSAQPTPTGSQIFIAEISNTVLQVVSPDKAPSQPGTGDSIDFANGVSLSTAETGYGYVRLKFPAQVDAYLASGTTMRLRNPAEERVSVDMLL